MALKQLHEQQRPAGCKSGLGFVEGNTAESNKELNLVKSKLNSISFVKGNSTDSRTENESLTPKDGSQHFNIKYVKTIDQKLA